MYIIVFTASVVVFTKTTVMKRSLYLFFLLIGLIGHQAWSQSYPFPESTSPRQEHFYLYQQGLELFEKEVYGASFQKFSEFLEAEKIAGVRGKNANDLHTHARYYQAVAAYFLDRNDALALMDRFIRDHSDNTRMAEVQYYQGKYFFDRRAYEEAIESLRIAYNNGGLDRERMDEVMFMLGYSYFYDVGNPSANITQALQYFDQLSISDNPYKEDVDYYRAIIFYKEEEYDRAYTAFKKIETSRKYGTEIQVYLANTLMKLGKYDELFVLADKLMTDRRRTDPQVYFIVANASYERGDYPNTTRYFREFMRVQGRMVRTDFFRMGFSYYKLGEYSNAVPHLQRVLTENDSLTQISSYYLGFCYLEEGDPESARFAFYKAISRDINDEPEPFDPVTEDALYQYAKVCYATGNFDEARNALFGLEKYYPNAPFIEDAKGLLGEIWLQNRNYAEAIKYFESAQLTNPRAQKAYQQATYYYGLDLYENREYQRAVVYLAKAQDNPIDPNIAQNARYWRSEALFRQGDFSEATRSFQQFMRQPGAQRHAYYSAANYGLAWSYFKEKKYGTAFNAFDEFIRTGGTKAPKKVVVDAHLRAGDCLFLQRQYAKANVYYQRAQKLGHGYEDYALYQVAEAQYRQRQYQASVKTFDQLIRRYRQSDVRDDALDRISEIYATWIKNYDQAARYAQVLIKDYPRSPLAAGAYVRLASAAYNSGNQSAAVKYFKKILADYGTDKTNAQIALDNLANLLPAEEFDRVLRDYRRQNPELDENLAELAFNTGVDRFFSENYASAINQFSAYIQDYKNGPRFNEALLYRARSYKSINELTKSLTDYERIYSASVKNEFTNTALLEAAEIRYEQAQYMLSLELYEMLDNSAEAVHNKVQAKLGIAKNHKAMNNYQQAQRILELVVNNPEVEDYDRYRAQVEMGECQYYLGDLDIALQTFQEVEMAVNDEHAAQSQYMITRILFEQGQSEAAKEAGLYMKNTYPTHEYWKARTFLVVAEANYALGETFQAKGVLESLIKEAPFQDIKEAAAQRLTEIEQAEAEMQPALTPQN